MVKYLIKKVVGQKRSTLIGKYLHNVIHRIRVHYRRFISCSKDFYTDYQLFVLGENKNHSFFGYYDISPFHSLTDEVIYLTLDRKEKDANIILEDLKSKAKQTIAVTQAWNWQQGSRLRWLPGSIDKIIFNDFKDKKYYSRILNVRTYHEDKIDFPIYDINANGTLGITLDFARLGVKRPGYGYTLIPYSVPNDLSEEGISLVDMKKNTVKLILTYQDVVDQLGIQYPQYNNYYLNHLSFSPQGNKFMFFFLDSSTVRHEAYMLVYDLEEKTLKVLEPNMKVSHYVWEDNGHIIATSYDKQMNCAYYRYSMDGKKEPIMPDILCLDGHPSMCKNNLILTDTYPNRKTGYQQLYLFDEKRQEIMDLVKIFSSPKLNGEKRTDLHPRFNVNKDKIAFDANIDGFRKLYYFNLK
jgi:hypothetical protein